MKLPKLPNIDSPTSTEPPSRWNKLLTVTPVVMTVVATLLAGLSSSEMTSSQYYRSLAAQIQSKASDQWAFFQAKRMRSTGLGNTLDVLQATADPGPFDPADLPAAVNRLGEQLARLDTQALELLRALDSPPAISEPGRPGPGTPRTPNTLGTELAPIRTAIDEFLKNSPHRLDGVEALKKNLLLESPTADSPDPLARLRGDAPLGIEPPSVTDPAIKAAMDAIDASKPEDEIRPLILNVRSQNLEAAFRAVSDQTHASDAATRPVTETINRLNKTLAAYAALVREPQVIARYLAAMGSESPATAKAFVDACSSLQAGAKELSNSLTAARLRFDARRYDAEARANQVIADLYEVDVRKRSASSEHHRARSQQFFIGMLVAQAAVVTSSLALAVQRRNILWSLAAAVGLAAAAFGAYVYLCV